MDMAPLAIQLGNELNKISRFKNKILGSVCTDTPYGKSVVVLGKGKRMFVVLPTFNPTLGQNHFLAIANIKLDVAERGSIFEVFGNVVSKDASFTYTSYAEAILD